MNHSEKASQAARRLITAWFIVPATGLITNQVFCGETIKD